MFKISYFLVFQNESNTQKLPGKTPGRERKPGGYQPIKNSSNMKQLSFKTPSTSFGLDSGVSAPKNNHVSFLPQATANIWTENRATFSDVVAHQPMFPVGQGGQEPAMKQAKMMKNSYMDQQKAGRRSAGDAQGMNVGGNLSNLGLGGGNMFNNKRNAMYGGRVKDDLSLYGSMDEGKSVNKRNSDDFGPIGTPLLTRNSPPFIQQNWEPMLGQSTGIQQPTPMSSYYQTQARSRFFDTFQNRSHLQQDNVGNMGQQQQDNSILEAANLMSQYPVWNADRNVLMEMFNRQQQQEQMDAWNRSTAWNPMNYSNTMAQTTQHQPNPGSWSVPVRPPPGLTLNRDRQHVGAISAHQQQQGSHISNNRPEEVVPTTSNAGNVTAAAQGEPMRTYDPFKSLSYLWQGSTDLWGSSASNNNNNKKQE